MNNIYDKDLSYRIAESERISSKHPGYIPVIILNDKLKIKKKKFLVPKDVSASYLLIAIRKHIELDSSQAIFMFCDNVLISGNHMMYDIYNRHVISKKNNGDLFLYITISCENTFG